MISFAQNLEDVLIARFFKGDAPQIYVDVGAAHPAYHSVTKHFSDAGWHGLNIEPRTHLWKLLRAERPADWNVHCAVSDVAGEMQFFEVTDPTFTGTDAGGLSTLDARQAAYYREQGLIVRQRTLKVYPLSQLLAEREIREIGFLKIDVEGFEYEVIKSLDWQLWRPRLVIAESTAPTTSVVCDGPVQDCLVEHGYLPVFFDGLNRYFVRQEDERRADRLRVPVNVSDGYVTAAEWDLQQQLEQQRIRIEEQLSQIADYHQLQLEYARLEAANQDLLRKYGWKIKIHRFVNRVVGREANKDQAATSALHPPQSRKAA